MSRSERDALRGVAGAHRPHAVAQLVARQLPDRVPRAADLERADGLKRFEFEEDLGSAEAPADLVRQRHADERSASGDAVDGSRGGLNVAERNLPHRCSVRLQADRPEGDPHRSRIVYANNTIPWLETPDQRPLNVNAKRHYSSAASRRLHVVWM